MHPILAKPARMLLYLTGWLPMLALLDYLLWSSGSFSWTRNAMLLAPACLLFAFVCLSAWPICRVRPLRLANVAVLAVTWTAAAVAASALFTGAVWAMARILNAAFALPGMLFATGILLYLLSAGLHYTALAGEASREAELQAAEAHSLARDAELHALRMQINPHFLFNSLHSIAVLSTQDGPRAREMCIRLSDFLRSSLGLRDRESVPLSEELALTRSYLEVEQVRFGARLQFSEDIQETCRDCAVPVLLLQPLVENAIKHGVSGLVEGGAIRLSVKRSGDLVKVAVENAFDSDSPPANKLGVGLAQVRRRLELRYGAVGGMDAGVHGGIYRVELRFPCESPMASNSRA